MRNVLAIARREVISYFYSPIAYIVLALFLFISGFFFFNALQWERGDLQNLFYPMGFVFFFFCPLITMRLMSEEMKMGTLETLMTAPVTDTQVIVGKFLAGMGFYIFLLLPTLLFPFMVSRIGQVQWGSVMAAYIGLVFLGCFYVSVGFSSHASPRTRSLQPWPASLSCCSFGYYGGTRTTPATAC
jgi:ABC-2 type transport system permease protein